MRRYSLAEAKALIMDALRNRELSEILIINTTTGAGKTQAALEYVLEKTREGGKVRLLGPTHKLLAEIGDRYEALGGGPGRHFRGLTAEVPGRAKCKLKMAKKAAELGVNVGREVCGQCPHRRGCEVRAEIKAADKDPSFGFGPREMVLEIAAPRKRSHAEQQASLLEGPLRHWDPAPELIVDEEIAAFTRLTIERKDLDAAPDLTYIDQKHHDLLIALLECRRGGLDVPRELRHRAQAFDHRAPLLIEGSAADAMKSSTTLTTLKVFKWLRLGAAPAGAFLRPERNGRLPARGPDPVLEHLLLHGGTVLTATPNIAQWQALKDRGHPIRMLDLPVEDAQPIERVWLIRSDSTRSKTGALGGDAPKMDRLKLDLSELCRYMPPWCDKLLIMTFRSLADAMRVDDMVAFLKARLPQLDQVEFTHYGALAGLDCWGHFNGFVTMYDCYPSEAEQVDIAHLMGVEIGSTEHRAECKEYGQAQTIQAHGRGRAPSRKSPAWFAHIGKVDPGWKGYQVELKDMPRGRPKLEGCPTVEEVARAVTEAGGIKRAASIVGKPERSVRQWVSGERSMRRDLFDKLEDATRTAIPAPDLGRDMAGLARATERAATIARDSRPPPPMSGAA